MDQQPGTLYIVATPIGNLADMTFRAIEILKSVDMILCEDTRTTKKLLDHYQVSNRTMSYHSHSGLNKVETIKELIAEGKNVALVSDAGTPCISDPGVTLVAELRKAFGNDFKVQSVPGASALISAVSISGIPSHEFVWLGFVPHKKGRETFFKEVSELKRTAVFYESVHRIMKTLESLASAIPDRQVAVSKELTKMFEETFTGTAQEAFEYFSAHPDKVRGEFVVIVAPGK